MTGLSREVLKWLQGLDLACQIRNPKWDLANGYIVAEILSHYFPQRISMHSFYRGCSYPSKKRNWFILKNFFLKNEIGMDMNIIEGTIHCREGAAVTFLENMYMALTNRRLHKVTPDLDTLLSNHVYQKSLLPYQRTTATRAVKNNIRLSEIFANEGFLDCTTTAQKTINEHLAHRREERFTDPARFGIVPTLGDRCVRVPELSKRMHLTPSHFGNIGVSSELCWKEIWTKCPFQSRDKKI